MLELTGSAVSRKPQRSRGVRCVTPGVGQAGCPECCVRDSLFSLGISRNREWKGGGVDYKTDARLQFRLVLEDFPLTHQVPDFPHQGLMTIDHRLRGFVILV